MKITVKKKIKQSAFTLAEALFGMALVGIVVISLYAGISAGFATVETARESLRATQIATERMEVIRLFAWSQWEPNPTFPTKFEEPYNFYDDTGFRFHADILISNVSFAVPVSYATNLKHVTVEVRWTNHSNIPRKRTMTTLVARDGMQNYVYD